MSSKAVELYRKKVVSLERKVERLKKQLVKAQRLAHVCSLTGLLDRRGLCAEAKRSLALAHRSNEPLGLLFVDLDLFKEVNDRHGHSVGDRILRDFARFLKKTVRASDTVARLSGDEFVVILPSSDLATAGHVAEKIQKALVVKRFVLNIRLSASVGACSTSEGVKTFLGLKELADARMYQGKPRAR